MMTLEEVKALARRSVKEAKKLIGNHVLADEWLEGCDKTGKRGSEVFKQRYDMCKGCKNYKSEPDECGVCGCVLFVKCALLKNINPRTLKLEITHCPINKWY